jgi:hypothetical protein
LTNYTESAKHTNPFFSLVLCPDFPVGDRDRLAQLWSHNFGVDLGTETFVGQILLLVRRIFRAESTEALLRYGGDEG